MGCGFSRSKADDQLEAFIQAEFSVGIDVGAAFSGYTLTTMETNDKVTQVWYYFPEEEDLPQRCPKTLSAILYRRAANRWRAVEWGRRAYNQYQEMPPPRRKDHCLLEDFKIALADDVERGRFMASLPEGCGLTVESVMADFLGFIRKHVLLKLTSEYQRPNLSPRDIKWTITVPANWSYQSQLVMREAAVAAGLVTDKYDDDRLSVIPEPEAAALSSVHHGETRSSPGETFMVVDAGGATTDITMHDVGADGHLAEATHASGLLAGSKLIDREFEDWLCSRVVGAEVFNEWRENNPADYLRLMHGDWQHAKCSYGDPKKTQWFLAIEPSLNDAIPQQVKAEMQLRGILGSGGDSLILHASEMEEFFRRIVSAVLDKVCEVVASVGRAPNKILLVGGLGSSMHLFNALEHLASGGEGWKAEVIQPAHGYSAVVEGAALFPKETVQIVKRIATRSYGVVLHHLPITTPDTKAPRDVRAPPPRPVRMFHPFIGVGDDVETRKENREIFFRKITIGGKVPQAAIPIYTSDQPEPVFGQGHDPVPVAKIIVDLAVKRGMKPPKDLGVVRDVLLYYRMGRSRVTIIARTWQDQRGRTCEVPFLYDPNSVLVQNEDILLA